MRITFVVGEPQGSPTWFPGNDNPRDTATALLDRVRGRDDVARTRAGRRACAGSPPSETLLRHARDPALA